MLLIAPGYPHVSVFTIVAAIGFRSLLIGAVQSLHQIQQEIAKETTDPWPATSDPEYRRFPEPAGQIVGDRLYLGFGDKAEPVLEFQSIDLADVPAEALRLLTPRPTAPGASVR